MKTSNSGAPTMKNTTNPKMTVGIDPGINGSMAFLTPTGIEVVRLPVRSEKRSTRTMRFIDAAKLHEILSVRCAGYDVTVFHENVFSMPDDTPMTAFSFGNSKGRIDAVLEVLGLKVIPIPPTTWKSRLGVTSDKKTSRRKCEALYPSTRFASVDDCEAALIATYGVLFHVT